jgi:CMP-2-keto-3-deoxyoctulosonic acid synthetase
MTPEQVQKAVSALAHSCLAKMLKREAHTDREVCAKATDHNGGLQIVVFFDRHVPMTADPLHHGPAGSDRYECCLTPTQKKIVQTCQPDTPLTAKQIARKVRCPYSSYLRGLLSRLVQLRYLSKTPAGYVLFCKSA